MTTQTTDKTIVTQLNGYIAMFERMIRGEEPTVLTQGELIHELYKTRKELNQVLIISNVKQ